MSCGGLLGSRPTRSWISHFLVLVQSSHGAEPLGPRPAGFGPWTPNRGQSSGRAIRTKPKIFDMFEPSVP